MAIEFYNDGKHKCVGFYDLVSGDGVQANQFLVVNGEHSALIDPGGELIYNDLYMSSYRYLFTKSLEYVIGSHQDPDIISSLNKWLIGSDCKIIVPALWERFIPHFATQKNVADRIIGIPDKGMDIDLGAMALKALPAHFLHSEGNFHFYDPVAKILFSGDMGASSVHMNLQKPIETAEDFSNHIKYMKGFHQRYMSGNKACRYWANMVKTLDLEWMIPQHGRAFKGGAIALFLDWISGLECGIDLVTQETYKVPESCPVDRISHTKKAF